MILESVRFERCAGAGEKDLVGQPARRVVVELCDVRDPIRVVGQSTRGVEKFLDAVVRPGTRAKTVQEVERLIDRDAGGTNAIGRAVLNVVNRAEHPAKGVARSSQQSLVAVP